MNNQNKKKCVYSAPLIECIQLDNEISLVLESTPAIGPGETVNRIPEYFNNDPFKTKLG